VPLQEIAKFGVRERPPRRATACGSPFPRAPFARRKRVYVPGARRQGRQPTWMPTRPQNADACSIATQIGHRVVALDRARATRRTGARPAARSHG
jgi:hypothetical protein